MDSTEIIMLAVLCLTLALIFGKHLYGLLVASKEKDREEQKAREKAEEELRARKKAYEEKEQNLISLYGVPSIEFKQSGEWDWDDWASRVIVFENSQIVLIQDVPIPFSKILSYTLADNKQTISTTTGNAETVASTASMAGRALAGGLLFGGAGAMAGAVTAKRETEINATTNYSTTHDYVIYLSIDEIANPQRVLRFGEDAEQANKAASVFNIIISRNK